MGRSVHNTPTITSVEETAGGMPAVISAWKHGVSKMGLVGSAVSLGKANQTNGFDCPGCAWPDPKHRSPFEYCENGAKAIADEATIKTIQTHWEETPYMPWEKIRSMAELPRKVIKALILKRILITTFQLTGIEL